MPLRNRRDFIYRVQNRRMPDEILSVPDTVYGSCHAARYRRADGKDFLIVLVPTSAESPYANVEVRRCDTPGCLSCYSVLLRTKTMKDALKLLNEELESMTVRTSRGLVRVDFQTATAYEVTNPENRYHLPSGGMTAEEIKDYFLILDEQYQETTQS